MPGYGMLPANNPTDLLPWSWAVERLVRSHYYWISSVRPDGRPHAMPVWGVFTEGQLWFSSSGASRKTLNIESSPQVVVSTDDAAEPVVVEGAARRVSSTAEPEAVHAFADALNAKYGTEYPAEFFLENATFVVMPDRVFGMRESEFESSPTRWTFV
jgi:nitroimidazol reductase NimA-like FMN-containing flavoprotein (pyridoxamine 5'-phosphate oxidase superfamily)